MLGMIGMVSAALTMALCAQGRGVAGDREPDAAADADALRARLHEVLTAKLGKARLGATVVTLPGGRVIYDHQADEPMIPASNMKLVVMAAAIDQLGADYKFETILATRGDDLVVIGGGDPTIGDERLCQARKEPITAVFHRWVEKLRAAGIAAVPGDIVIDDSIFDLQFVHPTWPADQHQKWYEAPVGGLNFNSNCVGVQVSPTEPNCPAAAALVPGNTLLDLSVRARTGAKDTVVIDRKAGSDTVVVSGTVSRAKVLGDLTVRDPGLYFGSVLKTVLAARGIRVDGAVVRRRVRGPDGRLPTDCRVIDVVRTPLRDALSRAGKNSLGMAAECLIKMLGARSGDIGAWSSGAAAVEAHLRKAGAPAGQWRVAEGSGLSRENRLSARSAVAVLRHAFDGGSLPFGILRDALAVGGVDGTLDKRLKWKSTRGRVFAKTGYIAGVRTLAGYVQTQRGDWLAFAFYYNDAAASTKDAADNACRILAEWPGPATFPRRDRQKVSIEAGASSSASVR